MYPREVWEALAHLVDDVAGVDSGVSTINVCPWVRASVSGARARGENDPADADKLFIHNLDIMIEYVRNIVDSGIAAARAKEAAERDMEEFKNSSIVLFSAESRSAEVKKLLWQAKHKALFFVSPNSDTDWRVLCCADLKRPYAFNSSTYLIPEKYRGLRDEEFQKLMGSTEATFCHAAGFTAGFKTKEAACDFARRCAEECQQQQKKQPWYKRLFKR
jgi:uncharacterized UPF0160 family protein